MIRKIIIEKETKESIISEIKKIGKLETGGVLCGYYSEDALIIDTASGPGPLATHCIDEFIIDKDYMDQFLNEEYLRSKGLNIYVGEWHTHPQKFPQPSEQDLVSMSERTLEWQHGEIIFLIIGFIEFSPKNLFDQMIAIYFDKQKKSFWRFPITIEI